MSDVSTMAKPFDMTLVQRGARLRRSPFYEATQRCSYDSIEFAVHVPLARNLGVG